MKQLFLTTALVLAFSLTTFAQDKHNPPQAVKTAFAQKFVTVSHLRWGQESSKEWEAEFKMNGRDYSANYDNEGQWLETEYAIKKSEIPMPVTNVLAKDFAGYKISGSEISETQKGKVYEFEVKLGEKKWEVAFDFSGKLISKENITKDED